MSDIGTASTPLMIVLLPLLPVVVGGLIGIIAGLVGTYFIQRAKDAADKKRKRAEKFEELVGAVVEHLHWINTMRNFRTFGIGSEPAMSSVAKIQAISDTYFPEFEDLVQQLYTASTDYEIWSSRAAQKKLRSEPEYMAGHENIVKTYMEKREALLTALRNFARREFQ